VAWQIYVLSATSDQNDGSRYEGSFTLNVVAKLAWANVEKIAIPSLPYQHNGSTVGAQTTYGTWRWRIGPGAGLYALQCPADANTRISATMVSAAAGPVHHPVPPMIGRCR